MAISISFTPNPFLPANSGQRFFHAISQDRFSLCACRLHDLCGAGWHIETSGQRLSTGLRRHVALLGLCRFRSADGGKVFRRHSRCRHRQSPLAADQPWCPPCRTDRLFDFLLRNRRPCPQPFHHRFRPAHRRGAFRAAAGRKSGLAALVRYFLSVSSAFSLFSNPMAKVSTRAC